MEVAFMSVPAQGILGPVLKYTVCSGIGITFHSLGGNQGQWQQAACFGCLLALINKQLKSGHLVLKCHQAK